MTAKKLVPVVLCGGSGSRLWPLSREQYPKQFLRLFDEHSLLQGTLLRLKGLSGHTHAYERSETIVVCNDDHRFLVAEQMREIAEPASLILEPTGKNTAPALTLAALQAQQGGAPAVMLVLPADHLIKDVAAFHTAILAAQASALEGKLVTFGIVPEYANTGFGYVEKGVSDGGAVFGLKRFIEKPDQQTAERLIESGNYLWNSGMFVIRTDVWLNAMELYAPDILAACQRSFVGKQSDTDFVRPEKTAFSECRSESIDYAVMEHVTDEKDSPFRACVIPLDAGWTDVGSWNAVADEQQKDSAGNSISGDVILENCQNCYAKADGRLVAMVGVKDVAVVETVDAILVMNMQNAQAIKNVVARIKLNGRHEHAFHRKVFRPWGSYEGIDLGERFQVKRITVNPGASLSSQMHHHRAEHWIVVSGTAEVTNGDKTFLLTENQSTYIPIGQVHRLRNPGRLPLEMIEVQSGAYLGEDDIVRFQDVYGRA